MSKTYTLLSAATTTATSITYEDGVENCTFQTSGTTSSGSGSATVVIEVSNDGTNWIALGTMTLTLATTSSSDGFAADASWMYTRARVSAISGTGAAVTVIMGL